MTINTQEKKIILEFIKKLNLIRKHKKLKPVKTDKNWKNFSKNLSLPKSLIIDIPDIQSLQETTKFIYQINETKKTLDRLTFRAIAGGRKSAYSYSYSFTPCTEADILIRLTGKEFQSIKISSEDVISVGASIQIGELDKILYEKYNLS